MVSLIDLQKDSNYEQCNTESEAMRDKFSRELMNTGELGVLESLDNFVLCHF
ncbi:MAG: hypothetical protein ACI9ZX_003064 [Algoriphagus sp.]|jgi:hypothetical protein